MRPRMRPNKRDREWETEKERQRKRDRERETESEKDTTDNSCPSKLSTMKNENPLRTFPGTHCIDI